VWAWFDEPDAEGRVRGRFYARNHYVGVIEVGGVGYRAIAFEHRDHDALYRASGLCIDLDGDGVCQEEQELFYDGDTLRTRGGTVRLELRYP
jgi:hypothetical protein